MREKKKEEKKLELMPFSFALMYLNIKMI